jgi:hypothetical protein
VYSCTLVLLASTKVRKYFHTTEGNTEVRKYGSTFVRKYFRKYESTFYEGTSVRKYLRRYSTCTVRVQYLSVQYLSTVFLREQHTVRRYFRKYNYNISYRATKIIKVHVVVRVALHVYGNKSRCGSTEVLPYESTTYFCILLSLKVPSEGK